MSPTITLIRPQMGENIGSAARNMANFGLRDMRIVAPRDGWPNPRAADTAGKALDIVDDAKLFDTAAEAVADAQFILATTSRDRVARTKVTTPREIMPEIRAKIAAGQKVHILFGPERTGLENEEVALADAVLSIPVSEAYPSINLSQAVGVVAYEWWITEAAKAAAIEETATREELLGMFNQLEAELDEVNFWRVPEKKELMWRNIRAGLMRAGLSTPEVATWRGIIRGLRGK